MIQSAKRLKICSTCKKGLPSTAFNKQLKARDSLQARCRDCAKIGDKKYKRTRTDYRRQQLREKYNSLEGKRKHLNRYFKSAYKITLEEYEQLATEQSNKCAICGAFPDDDKRLYVDHCHDSKKVRGLLCFHCNTGLGHFRDNSGILKNAINYLYDRNK